MDPGPPRGSRPPVRSHIGSTAAPAGGAAPAPRLLLARHPAAGAVARLIERHVCAGSSRPLPVACADPAGLARTAGDGIEALPLPEAPGPFDLTVDTDDPAADPAVDRWLSATAALERWTEDRSDAAAGRTARTTATTASTAASRGGSLLLVCHEASRTGAPVSLLALARWLAANTPHRLTTLFPIAGPLVEDFAAVGRVIAGLDRLTPSDLRSTDLLYANTVVNGRLVSELRRAITRVVTHSHELDYAISLYREDQVRAGLLASDHLIAVSARGEEALRRVLAGEERPITRVTEPLGDERVGRAAELGSRRHRPGPLVVGACGTFDWLKGSDTFLRLASRARGDSRFPEWTFRWVGQVPAGAGRERLDAAQLVPPPDVDFPGPTEDPMGALAGFDVLAMLSRQDSYPLAMLEAALLGVPVIGFAGSGGPEEFAGDGAGLVVPYLDVEAVLAELAILGRHPGLRRLLGAAARAKVLARNRIDHVAPRCAAVIDSLLDGTIAAPAAPSGAPPLQASRPEPATVATPALDEPRSVVALVEVSARHRRWREAVAAWCRHVGGADDATLVAAIVEAELLAEVAALTEGATADVLAVAAEDPETLDGLRRRSTLVLGEAAAASPTDPPALTDLSGPSLRAALDDHLSRHRNRQLSRHSSRSGRTATTLEEVP